MQLARATQRTPSASLALRYDEFSKASLCVHECGGGSVAVAACRLASGPPQPIALSAERRGARRPTGAHGRAAGAPVPRRGRAREHHRRVPKPALDAVRRGGRAAPLAAAGTAAAEREDAADRGPRGAARARRRCIARRGAACVARVARAQCRAAQASGGGAAVAAGTKRGGDARRHRGAAEAPTAAREAAGWLARRAAARAVGVRGAAGRAGGEVWALSDAAAAGAAMV